MTTDFYGHLGTTYLKKQMEHLSFGPATADTSGASDEAGQGQRRLLAVGGAWEPPLPAVTRDEARSAAPFVTRLVPKPQNGEKRSHAREPLERKYAGLELSGREDLNLRPFGPESGPEHADNVLSVDKSAQSLHAEGSGESSPSQDLGGFSKDFATRLLPESSATDARGGAEAGGGGAGPQGGAGARPRASTAATLGDLQMLWGGRDRLLRVAEVAEQLAVGAWAVYKLCEDGDLSHVRINNSIRVRPADLAEFVTASRKAKRRKKGPSPE
jgi:excisionase family DNA binding protein